jgi:hypothetical protein
MLIIQKIHRPLDKKITKLKTQCLSTEEQFNPSVVNVCAIVKGRSYPFLSFIPFLSFLPFPFSHKFNRNPTLQGA